MLPTQLRTWIKLTASLFSDGRWSRGLREVLLNPSKNSKADRKSHLKSLNHAITQALDFCSGKILGRICVLIPSVLPLLRQGDMELRGPQVCFWWNYWSPWVHPLAHTPGRELCLLALLLSNWTFLLPLKGLLLMQWEPFPHFYICWHLSTVMQEMSEQEGQRFDLLLKCWTQSFC